MPSGDAQRRWFPEVVSLLRARWRSDLSWTEVVSLRDELDAMVREIRTQRGIRPPTFRCARCGSVEPAEFGPLSVRAVILALGRFGIAEPDAVDALDEGWASHRKAARLDPVGRRRGTAEKRAKPECARPSAACSAKHPGGG